ncbi:phage tail tape measure protein [Streptococcus suis]|uniref:Phage tail protein n=3 Tax=Streptococcus suis TaxID=1307 RepID=A0A0Z8LZD8_STRSU|nr:phage tail tape measure protein [Streptococcus suis]QBX30984.1 tail length tape-measure protein [Streptococcus phage Javan584]NQG70295.1 phage tail tape measure protein [Streptococcus suis]NQH63383.1 phage tail tape measure protein [Streptococcus suis]NQS05841.1 phage tail tape measure protein [Streptococcus suis]CYU51605.1 phage tail protein [Streptococcus suis]
MAGNGTPLGQMVIELNLDATKMGDSMTRVKNQLKNFEKQVRAQRGLSDYYKTGSDAAKALEKQKEALTKSIEAQRQVLSRLNKEYQTESKANGEMSKKAQQLAGRIEDGNTKLARYAIQLREVSKEAYLATSKLNIFGDKLAAISKGAQNWENGLNTVSQRTQALSLAIFGGMTLSAKAAMDFESAFAGVKKTVDETQDWSYERLSNEIRKMSQELPASAVEISKVAEAAGQLGIKTEDIISFTRVMIDMGESTNMSAEEAAVALAKFKNITGMPTEDFKKLGNVIVQLGNNMATTEQDIVDMGLRLASSGKLAGLTEAQIMALAATLSSVGMEAEAGGSAMSRVMQKMNTAVAEGEEALDKFAAVAGMSAEEFAAKWKAEPQNAIVDFLNGLRRIKEEGGDVTQTLKNMKISNIRDIDSLQRLAGAGELLAKTLGMANKEWASGNALQTEAQKRYETTESKLKMARNKLNDIAITLGGPLLDAFLDVLDASEPLIDDVASLAKGFAELDKGTQRNIINMALMVGAISPVSKILGTTFGTIGDLTGGIANLSKWLANIGAERAGQKAIEAIGATAGASASSVGGLSSAVSLLGNPITWGVILGGAALVGLTYLTAELGKAYQRTQEWGTEVDKVQAEQLSEFKDKVDETTKAMELFGKNGKQDVEGIQQAVKDLVSEITLLADEKLAKDVKLAEQLGLSETVINALKKSADDSKQYIQRVSDEMLDIYKRHAKDHTQLSAEEQQLVLQYQTDLINEQLELMDYSSEERIAIQKAMNGELADLNKVQLDNVFEQTTKWMADERKAYKDRRTKLKETLNEIKGDSKEEVDARKEINAELESLEANHNAVMDTYQQKFIQIMREKWEREKEIYKDRPEVLSAYEQSYREVLNKYGISWEEFINSTSEGVKNLASDYDYLGKIVKGMSDEAVDANARWESLVWDEKEQKLKTNVDEVLQKAVESENGWNDLKFILKNATIDSNARELIVEAMSSSEAWNSLTINEKQMIVDGNQAMIEIATSQDLLNQWNALTPAQKQLLAENLTANPVIDAQWAINNVKQDKPAEIKASDLTGGIVKQATQSINSVPNREITIKALDNASWTASYVKEQIDSIPNYKEVVLKVLQRGEVHNPLDGYVATFTGTNFHPGGFALVNDQIGPMYKELITLPSGESFIPNGRNVLLDLPRGSKVLKASSTERLMGRLGIPNYAEGIGFPEDASLFKGLERFNASNNSGTTIHIDNSNVVGVLREILTFLTMADFTIKPADVYLDKAKVGQMVMEFQDDRNWIESAMRGVRR